MFRSPLSRNHPLLTWRWLTSHSDSLFVTAGATSGLVMLCTLLFQRDDSVCMPEITYFLGEQGA